MFKILLLASFVPALLAFSTCSNGAATPDLVVSSLCNAQNECEISVGDPIDIKATFTAAFSTERVHPTIWAYLGDDSLQIDTEDVFYACDSITPGCPIEEGTTYTYELNVPVDETGIHGVQADLELALVTDDGATLVCIRFSAWMN